MKNKSFYKEKKMCCQVKSHDTKNVESKVIKGEGEK